MSEDGCCFKNCKGKVEIEYYGKFLCDKHWNKLCDKTVAEMKEALDIKEKK